MSNFTASPKDYGDSFPKRYLSSQKFFIELQRLCITLCLCIQFKIENSSIHEIDEGLTVNTIRISLKTCSKDILHTCGYDMVGSFRFLDPLENELITEPIHQQ